MSAHPNASRDHFKLFAGLLSNSAHLLPAGAAFLLFADVVNRLDPRDLGRKGFAPTLSSVMGTNLYGLLFRLLAVLGKEDLLSLVEQQMLTAVILAELLRPTTEDPAPQKLNLLEVFQRLVLVLDLLGTFLLQAGLELLNQNL